VAAKGELSSRLSVMTFLNEVADDYPEAISLASGRPAPDFFDMDGWSGARALFDRYMQASSGASALTTARRIAQYGRTAGMINDLVAEQLRRDEGLPCDADRVVITNGCQEALALCLQALCSAPGDVLLVRNPTYIGATGAAEVAGIELLAVDERLESWTAAIETALHAASHRGRRIRAFYVIPQFDNPTGSVLTEEERVEILDVCARNRVVVLEDNPYGMFHFDGPTLRPMAALDDHGAVIYLATYSKTLCPAVRVGCAVLPKTLFGDGLAARVLATQLVQRKSLLTVNTSQFNQALVGGVILAEEGTLSRIVEAPRRHYARNRDTLVNALAAEFAGYEEFVAWNHPLGGFFLTLELPFSFGAPELVRCAADYGVAVLPMLFFSLDDSQRFRVRLAYSDATPAEITRAVAAFGRSVRDRMTELG
jgi:(S)-3,5-dihydroxyphenylglycine transaminase